MVDGLVTEVRLEKGRSRLASPTATASRSKGKSTAKSATKTTRKPKAKKKTLQEMTCPKCKKGNIIKGKTSYGCSQWNTGCTFRIPFVINEKKLSDNQVLRILEKGSTTNLKGLKMANGSKIEALVRLDANFNPVLEPKTNNPASKKLAKPATPMPPCPKCKKGLIIKGQTAYGCSNWKAGCDFRFMFADIKKAAAGRPLTKELVLEIVGG